MKKYVDFSEPAPRNTWRKIEYREDGEKFGAPSISPNHPYSRDVMNGIKREPRALRASDLLERHMAGQKAAEVVKASPKVMSKTAEMARDEIFKKLGIER